VTRARLFLRIEGLIGARDVLRTTTGQQCDYASSAGHGKRRALGDCLPGGFGRHRRGSRPGARGIHIPPPRVVAAAVRVRAAMQALPSGVATVTVAHGQADHGVGSRVHAHHPLPADGPAGAGKGNRKRGRRSIAHGRRCGR